MKFFIDTANVDEIREAASLGVLDGVTTNPSLVAKEGRDFHQVLREIVSLVNGPISAEVTAEDRDGMLQQGRELAKIHPNIVIKLPITKDGVKACKKLPPGYDKVYLTGRIFRWQYARDCAEDLLRANGVQQIAYDTENTQVLQSLRKMVERMAPISR